MTCAIRKIPPRLVCPVTSAAASSVEGTERREMFRDAALGLDRTRRELGKTESDRVRPLWEGLMRGRLTLVDWFDADGRRLILIKLNGSKSGCACGLTVREREVALSAALGESNKITGYRLGISPSRVSTLLRTAMQKLGVRTKAQLVVMVRVLGTQPERA